MIKLTVEILKGLPASGKSTYAKEKVAKDPKNWKRINKDDLRSMLHTGVWTPELEKDIILARNTLIKEFLAAGYNIVADDTNLNSKHISSVQAIVDNYNNSCLYKKDAEVVINDSFLEVPYTECIIRDAKRGDKSVGEKVIRKMYNQYIAPYRKVLPVPAPPIDKQLCVVCDLDGTLSLNTQGRSYYDASDCHNDSVNHAVLEALRSALNQGHKLIFVSGREDKYREQTVKFLHDSCNLSCLDYFLLMRKTSDTRKDSEVKLEIYHDYIEPNYYVLYWYDDRDQVVKALREIGIQVFQVNYGDF